MARMSYSKKLVLDTIGARRTLLSFLFTISVALANASAQERPALDVKPKEYSSSKPRPAAVEQPGPVNLLTGSLLASSKSPLRWGQLSVLAFDVIHIYDTNYRLDSVNQKPAHITAVRGLIGYSMRGRHSTMDLQYMPSIWVLPGIVRTDFLGHGVSISAFRNLGPRWSVNIGDDFSYALNNAGQIDPSFRLDSATGNTSGNSFIDANKRHLYNSLYTSANYLVNAQNTLTSRIESNYVDVSDFFEPGTSPLEQRLTGRIGEEVRVRAGLGWTHAISPHQQFGLDYTYERQMVLNLRDTSQFHSALFHYNTNFRPTVRFDTMLGPSWNLRSSRLNAAPTQESGITYQGNIVLSKLFRTSDLAISLARDARFSGIVSDNLSDRLDLTYTRQLGRRWNTVLEGGYVRQHFMNRPPLSTTLALLSLGYHLNPTWSLVVSYSYMQLPVSSTVSAPRHLASGGIRWSPMTRSRASDFGSR